MSLPAPGPEVVNLAPGLDQITGADPTALVSPWARRLWLSLPQVYQRLDAVQSPRWPLLRYLQGPGGEAQRVRDESDRWWDGVYTDPDQVPSGPALTWLAQVMGVRTAGVPEHQVRGILADFAAGGRRAVGTRQQIAEAARRALTGDRQVSVVPSAQDPHRLVVLVRADELTAEGLEAVLTQVRAAGVVPAGHVLVAQAATASWNAWEAAVGATWDEVESRLMTWTDADSAGVQLS